MGLSPARDAGEVRLRCAVREYGKGMSSPLRPLIDEMIQAMRDNDLGSFQDLGGQIIQRSQGEPPDFLTAVIEDLAPVLGTVAGVFSKTAILAGALVEFGGSPLPLSETVPGRAVAAMTFRGAFPAAWEAVSGGQPLPEEQTSSEITDLFTAHADEHGLRRDQAAYIALSWFDVGDWIDVMITAMGHREFRAALPAETRERVRESAAEIAEDVDRADFLQGLAMVLDDEPLIVLDPASGRGFRLTMSGVGDNYQLHTLLADRLSSLGLGFEPPLPAWVEAATTGHPGACPPPNHALRRFRLFDGTGAYAYPEGRPADIGLLDGKRVLVIHPPLGRYGWQNGRIYEAMVPVLTLDAELSPDEAASWLARVAPAVEDDVMAGNEQLG